MSGTPAALTGVGLSKRYGDLPALDNVDLVIARGEAIGIVGPNGAGKTTLLNVLAGSVRPSKGSVLLDGTDITRLSPQARCRRGIGRAFQIPRPFAGMTVLENVIVGARAGAGLAQQAAFARAIEVLDRCGLTPLANRPAGSLGLLHRKRLELARALATGPSVLLLDEIGAGLTEAEAGELVSSVQQVHAWGVSIIWIEHIVGVLLQVVQRLICMESGRVIADGPPEQVLEDAAVVDAYIGRPAR